MRKLFDKEKVLDWLLVSSYILVGLEYFTKPAWFGQAPYLAVAALTALVGLFCVALSLACRDRLKSPRFAMSAVLLVGALLFLALPFA